jgi:protoheme IX farnesyltransferase
MARTSKRALVKGDIPETAALIYASVLGIVGFAVLWIFVNVPTVVLGVVGFVSYVALYTPSKRRNEYSTLIGSISGATPIAAGYTAATGRFDMAALLLFLIMVIWQMPHFYAIAIFRRDEYAKAGVPILSVTRGIEHTKLHIIGYITAFVLVVLGFALFGYASFGFFIIMAVASLYWLWVALHGLRARTETVRWSRKVFGISLLMLLVMSASLAVDYWLP